VCPYSGCCQHFRKVDGRTKHIQAHHHVESGSHEPNPSAPPLPIPNLSSHPSSPIPFNHTSSPSLSSPSPLSPSSLSPSPLPPSDYLPPPFHGFVDITPLNSDAEEDLDAAPGINDPQVPDTPSIKRNYHRDLNDNVVFFPSIHLH
jgi:hypothetical protein